MASSMDSAMLKKGLQGARGKTTMVASSSLDLSKTGKRKPIKRNWTQEQSGGCGYWCGQG